MLRITRFLTPVGSKKKYFMVLRTGFEPAIFAVRGRCPEPLDDRSTGDNKIPANSGLTLGTAPRTIRGMRQNTKHMSNDANENQNPDFNTLNDELQVFELMIPGYVGSMVRIATGIPDDKWNWSMSERTPTARELCEHAFAWLVCDRQQMTVLDRSLHQPTPNLPADRLAMIELLQEEANEWRRLIRSLKPEDLDAVREPWPDSTRCLRSFLFHMGQNVIYKLGQISMLAFELGLDGGDPYDAPIPNKIYEFEGCPDWPSPRV